MSFSYAGKSIFALCSTLADVASGRSVAMVAAAFAPNKAASIKATSKKATTRKPTKTEEATAQTVAGRASDALDAVKANDAKDKMSRLGSFNESSIPFLLDEEKNVITIPTASLIVSAGSASERRAIISNLRDQFGLQVIEEGFQGKVLMRASEDGADGIKTIQGALNSYPRGANAISPNFLRVREHRRIDASTTSSPALPWNLQNLGAVGVAGADVNLP